MTQSWNIIKEAKSFDGKQLIVEHEAKATGTTMRASVYLPPAAEHGPVPWVMYLSGLTCTEANFTEKAGAQRDAARLGLAIVAPDTSPRGLELPGEHESTDFGSGAGFYVDATVAPYRDHYRMYSYVTEELFAGVAERFPLDPSRGRHHGALYGWPRCPCLRVPQSANVPLCVSVLAHLPSDDGAMGHQSLCRLPR